MNIETIREFLGWCTIINYGLMILAFLRVYALRNTLAQFRQELFGLRRGISAAITRPALRELPTRNHCLQPDPVHCVDRYDLNP